MSTVLPTRWPVAVDPSQALGYLLARHVPIEAQPHGAQVIREAAGWVPPGGLRPGGADVTATGARSWMRAAQQHARVLGPPPGLDGLLDLLGDGVIRPASAAHAVLAVAGAGELANPQVLVDFAQWCGTTLPFQVVPLGTRDGRRVYAYTRSVDDLVRARAVVDTAARRQGAIAADDAVDRLTRQHLHIDPLTDARDLRDLLSVAGTPVWWWPRRPAATPLTRTMHRLHTIGSSVPIARLPDAIARSRRTDWPTPDAEPLPVHAIRHWVGTSPQWRLTKPDHAQPVRPLAATHPHDHHVAAVLPPGQTLTWKTLHGRLVHRGLSGPTAAAIIRHSPLLRRVPNGYTALHDQS